jgi:predicted branched-subunit amino acid permease
MEKPAKPMTPDWVDGATQLRAFVYGLFVMASTPGMVLFSTSLGFGALARDLGFTFGHAVFLTGTLYALPAQVLMIDQIARDAALTGIALAISLTAVRLLPMTVALMPYIREEQPTLRGWIARILVSHFFAISVWLEGMRRLPLLPQHLRLAHIAGIGFGMLTATMMGTATGYVVSASLPPAVAAGLLFMTPLYFLLSLAGGASTRMDWSAIAIGCVLGPSLYVLLPGPDLMLTGLIGGTLAYIVGRWVR